MMLYDTTIFSSALHRLSRSVELLAHNGVGHTIGSASDSASESSYDSKHFNRAVIVLKSAKDITHSIMWSIKSLETVSPSGQRNISVRPTTR
jgi:hypothetical protein